MIAITKFQANDGSEHNTAAAALSRDALLEEIEAVMKPLGKRNNSTKGWIQHHVEVVKRCRQAFLRLCRNNGYDRYPVFHNEDVHPFSAVGRILDDSGGPLTEQWGRFMCIDEKGREHHQPFYALNKPESSHTCLEYR